MIRIRELVPADVGGLLPYAEAMHQESPRYRGRDFSIQKARQVITYLLDHGGGFVAEDENGNFCGMIGGVMTEHFFGDDKYVADLVVYVTPEKRGSSAAVRLIKALEDWAFTNGACEVLLGVSTGINTDAAVCVYKKLGYIMSSHSLIKTRG